LILVFLFVSTFAVSNVCNGPGGVLVEEENVEGGRGWPNNNVAPVGFPSGSGSGSWSGSGSGSGSSASSGPIYTCALNCATEFNLKCSNPLIPVVITYAAFTSQFCPIYYSNGTEMIAGILYNETIKIISRFTGNMMHRVEEEEENVEGFYSFTPEEYETLPSSFKISRGGNSGKSSSSSSGSSSGSGPGYNISAGTCACSTIASVSLTKGIINQTVYNSNYNLLKGYCMSNSYCGLAEPTVLFTLKSILPFSRELTFRIIGGISYANPLLPRMENFNSQIRPEYFALAVEEEEDEEIF